MGQRSAGWESGLGVGGIPYSFRDMQVEKLFVGAAT